MIGSYVAIVRRNLVWIVCLALAISAAVFGYLSAQPLQYRSAAVIEVKFTSASEQVLGQQRAYEEPQRRVTTEAELATSRPVAELAAERLTAAGRRSTAPEIQSVVEATPQRSSNLVEVAATDRTPRGAQAIARAVSESYLEYRRGLETAELEALQRNLRTAREDARQELATAPADERDAAAAKVRNINSLLDTLRLRLSLNPSNELLRSEASLPDGPANGLSNATALTVALLAGCLLALALVLVSEWLHDSVRTRAEAEVVAGAPVLGVVRTTSTGRRRGDFSDGAPPTGEGERSLRLGLARHFGGTLPSTVLLASLPTDAVACVSTARALAVSCAASGQSVLLVADDAQGEDGQYLTGSLPGRPDGLVRRPSALPGVHQAAATSADGAGGVFDLASPGQVLRDLAEAFDLVLVAAPGQRGVEAVHVGPLVDATVPVCALQRTSAKRFRQFVAELTDGGAVVPGVVVSDVDRTKWRARLSRTAPGAGAAKTVPPHVAVAPETVAPRARVR